MARVPRVGDLASSSRPGVVSKSRQPAASLDARWVSGTWLGQRWGSNAQLVAVSPVEVVEARSVIRVDPSQCLTTQPPGDWKATGSPDFQS